MPFLQGTPARLGRQDRKGNKEKIYSNTFTTQEHHPTSDGEERTVQRSMGQNYSTPVKYQRDNIKVGLRCLSSRGDDFERKTLSIDKIYFNKMFRGYFQINFWKLNITATSYVTAQKSKQQDGFPENPKGKFIMDTFAIKYQSYPISLISHSEVISKYTPFITTR